LHSLSVCNSEQAHAVPVNLADFRAMAEATKIVKRIIFPFINNNLKMFKSGYEQRRVNHFVDFL
jgi:hypothetical protein